MKQTSRSPHRQIRPVPRATSLALALLGLLSLSYLILTLPWWAPENLFRLSDSRLQIPVDVLFNRVQTLRPLTPADDALRGRFVNLESRLLYLQFGPDVLAGCPFCNSDEPNSYLYYALPTILWPHVANLIAIAAVTSPTWTGRAGTQWRSIATIAAGVLMALEVYLVSSYNYQANARATRLAELDMFHWNARVVRLLALATLDALLAWVLYLSATNRAFADPPSPAERVELANRALASVKGRLGAVGILRNTMLRDEQLRARNLAYWNEEVRLMSEVMEERDVVEGVNDALEKRIKLQDITADAADYTQSMLLPMEIKKDQ